jgi:hypothetical protein
LFRRRAAAIVCLMSCRGLLEIPDDPHVDPDSREEHYRHERRGPDEPEAPADAGASLARPPAIAPVAATGVEVTPSGDAQPPGASPSRPSAGSTSAEVDAGGDEVAPDAASGGSPFIVARSRGIAAR